MSSLPKRSFKDHARDDLYFVTETYWTLTELEFYDVLQRVWARAYLKEHRNDNDDLKRKWEEFIQEEKDIKKKKDKSFEYKDRLAALEAYKNISLERHSRWFHAWSEAKRGQGPEPKEYRECEEYFDILKKERANREKEEQYLREIILARDRDPETGRRLPPPGVKQAVKRTFGWGRKPEIVVSNLISDLADKTGEDPTQLANAILPKTAGQRTPNRSPDASPSLSPVGGDSRKRDRDRQHKCTPGNSDCENGTCVEGLKLKEKRSAESLKSARSGKGKK